MTLEFTHYEDSNSIHSPRATMTWVCDADEAYILRDVLLRSLNGNNPTLKCATAHVRPLQDPGSGKCEVSAEFEPAFVVDSKTVGAPFKLRIEGHGEAVTWTTYHAMPTSNLAAANDFVMNPRMTNRGW